MSNTSLYRRVMGVHLSRLQYGTQVYTYSDTILAEEINMGRSSGTTPGYFHIVSTGQGSLPNNQFGYNCETVTSGYGYRRYTQGNDSSQESGYWSGWNTDNVFHFSDLEAFNAFNGARTAAKLKVLKQDVNIAVAIGEGHQTYKMIAESAGRIRRAYSAIKRGRVTDAAKALKIKLPNATGLERLWKKDRAKAVSQAWLELQYGWLPLMSDIYGASQFIQKMFLDKPIVMKVSSSKSLQYEKTVSSISNNRSDTSTYTARQDHRVIYEYELSSQHLHDLAALGITNPLGLAWELMPFSFVVDWFAQVGNFLNQFDATVGWTFKKGCETRFLETTVVRRTLSHGGRSGYTSYDEDITAERKLIQCSRIGLTSEPISLAPYIKNPFSSKHAANAVTLLHTNLKR